ncbi:hypothetical protein [Streptomyces sp. NPDC055962]|uniref:hypothetical protein n=1 Tax=unclassified Streptomyces TaxID=2593676 RepID=UPI0035DD9D2F
MAGASGLGSADSMRQHIQRRLGVTPSAYRASFGRVVAVTGSVPARPCAGA